MIPAARRPAPGSTHGGPASARTRATWRAVDPAGVLLALVAGAWHALLLTRATNDNFLHMTLARQLLAGDWPVRDFFDHGWVLQYTLSAAAQSLFGQRLASEAVVVGIAWAIGTYLVFRLVRELTGSRLAAALAAILLIVSGARGYSYPKGIVYAVAATLWWHYVRTPTAAGIVWFGAWSAVAFYWRPDHGVYVACALVLAVLVAHGLRTVSVVRCSIAGAATSGLMAPFLLFVHLTVGLPEYVQTGVIQAQVEHSTHGTHEWPLLGSVELVTIAPAEEYAPGIGIRWVAGSAAESRREVLDRYGLTPLPSEDDSVERVRLSERSLPNIRALINEPLVEDTAGVDRSTATLPASTWSRWHRWSFEHAWLRLRLLPSLEGQARAAELTAALFYALPLLLIVSAAWMPRHLSSGVTAGRLASFATVALVVDLAMLRNPFPARAPDAVVLSAVVFGCCIAALWRAGLPPRTPRGALVKAGAVAIALVVIASVAGAGQFGGRVTELAGGWTSLRRARMAWGEAYGEIMASPPLGHYRDRPANLERRLAAFVRECVPPGDRLLLLWFAPDIYYNSDRLMAQRHLVFVPAWAALEHEQRMTLEKVRRHAPPVVLARRSALEEQARASYPSVVEYVEREYEIAATIHDSGEQYLVFARRDRAPLRAFGDEGWPCYVREPSEWSRVGRVEE